MRDRTHTGRPSDKVRVRAIPVARRATIVPASAFIEGVRHAGADEISEDVGEKPPNFEPREDEHHD
jgi:hypothetical protein